MSQRIKNRSYYQELGSAILLYAAVLLISMRASLHQGDSLWRTALLLTPMVPCLLAIWAIVRHVRRIDEYLRQFLLTHLSIAAAVTAGCTITYGFLEIAGFPHLSMFVVWPLMGAVWGISAGVSQWRRQ